MSTSFNGLTLTGALTLTALGNGKYIQSGLALGAPGYKYTVTPGSLSTTKTGTFRRAALSVQLEVDVVVNGVTTREKVTASFQLTAGPNITEATINSVIDRIAEFPDGGRLSQWLQGAS